jgi:hypothetical protein
MSRILNKLSQEGHHIDPDAVAGIHPYGIDHLIRLGRITLMMHVSRRRCITICRSRHH